MDQMVQPTSIPIFSMEPNVEHIAGRIAKSDRSAHGT